MKLKGLLLRVIIVLSAVPAIISCNKGEDEAFVVISDVYYINQIIDNEVQTGVAYYAFGNKAITSASVTLPGGGTVELQSNQTFWYTWFKEPDIEEYTTGYPSEGTYDFEITSEAGDVMQSSDELEIDSLEIPVIDSIEYNSNLPGYKVTWNEIEKAHGFVVKIKNSDGNFIFSGYTVSGDTNSYDVIEGGAGQWVENPVDGETYTFQIQALRFDNDANQSNYIYNFEEVSIGETNVVWGM